MGQQIPSGRSGSTVMTSGYSLDQSLKSEWNACYNSHGPLCVCVKTIKCGRYFASEEHKTGKPPPGEHKKIVTIN